MAEVPKVPKHIALFPQAEYAGYDANLFDMNPTGQPFANVGTPGMPGMMPVNQGFPPAGNMMYQQPPPMMPGQGVMMGQQMGPSPPGTPPMAQQGGGPPMGQSPLLPPMQQGGMPLMGQLGMGGGLPPPPPGPGQLANSSGPISRLKQMYQNDPATFMLLMSGLAQSGTNPEIVQGMASNAIQGRKASELKREEIDATRANKQEYQRDKKEYQLRNKIESFYARMQRDKVDPMDVYPEGKGGIETEEDLEYANARMGRVMAKQGREDRFLKLAKAVAKGELKSLEGTEFANDPEFEAQIEDVKNLRTNYDETKRLALDAARTRLELIEQQLKNAKAIDPGTKANMQSLRDYYKQKMNEYSAWDSTLRSVTQRGDLYGVSEELTAITRKLEREYLSLMNAYNAQAAEPDAPVRRVVGDTSSEGGGYEPPELAPPGHADTGAGKSDFMRSLEEAFGEEYK